MDQRLHLLHEWLRVQLNSDDYQLAPASSDASFRRYFRVIHGGQSTIIMDAPPDREDSAKFARLAKLFGDIGVHVPEILTTDFEKGFLQLSDLGSTQYLSILNGDNLQILYGDALNMLRLLPEKGEISTCGLPEYDRALLTRELGIFTEWLLDKRLGMTLSGAAGADVQAAFELLIGEALQQPRVWVHRDYHSRNLMHTAYHNPGVLDFQDAVVGPVTYDVVSLLRDCYIQWPADQVTEFATSYYNDLMGIGRMPRFSLDQYMRWFDLMGMQRHLKAIGIFSRLDLRDGKPGYLGDIPRTLRYVLAVCRKYSTELGRFGAFLEQNVVPRFPG